MKNISVDFRSYSQKGVWPPVGPSDLSLQVLTMSIRVGGNFRSSRQIKAVWCVTSAIVLRKTVELPTKNAKPRWSLTGSIHMLRFNCITIHPVH